eukprot:Gb_35779 [translate_table: standard]
MGAAMVISARVLLVVLPDGSPSLLLALLGLSSLVRGGTELVVCSREEGRRCGGQLWRKDWVQFFSQLVFVWSSLDSVLALFQTSLLGWSGCMEAGSCPAPCVVSVVTSPGVFVACILAPCMETKEPMPNIDVSLQSYPRRWPGVWLVIFEVASDQSGTFEVACVTEGSEITQTASSVEPDNLSDETTGTTSMEERIVPSLRCKRLQSQTLVTEQGGAAAPMANGELKLADKAIDVEEKLKLAQQRMVELEKELMEAKEKAFVSEARRVAEQEILKAFVSEATKLTSDLCDSASEILHIKDDADLSEKFEEITKYTLSLREKEKVLQEQVADAEHKRKEMEVKLNMQTELLQEEMKNRALKEDELNDARAKLTRLEMDLNRFEENALDLEGQLKSTMEKSGEYKKLAKQNEEASIESYERALEYDNLSLISESRAKEMEEVVTSLQEEILRLHGKIASCEHAQEVLNEESKLLKAEEELKCSQEQISELEQKLISAELVMEEYKNSLKLHEQAEVQLKEKIIALEKLSVDSEENLRFKLYDLNDSSYKLQETKESLEPIEHALKQGDTESSELQRELQSSIDRCVDLDHTVAQLSQKVYQLEEWNTTLKSQVKVSEDEIINLESLLKQSSAKNAKLEQKLKSVKENCPEQEAYSADSNQNLEDLVVVSQAKWVMELEQRDHELDFSSAGISGMDTRSVGKQLPKEEPKHTRILEDSPSRIEELEHALFTSRQKEQELQDIAENSSERLLEVENLAEILKGISKDTHEKLDILEQDMKNASQREIDLQIKLKDTKGKLSAEESRVRYSTTRCMELEQLLESQANDAELKLLEAKESYAHADSEAKILTEKLNALVDLVKESDDRAAHASKSVVAQQVELQLVYAKLAKMEISLQDLQGKILVAECRAQNAEKECAALSKKNSKVNDELAHLQTNMDGLQAAFNQVESEKQSAADQVTAATKSINDLTGQLAEERERLQKQPLLCQIASMIFILSNKVFVYRFKLSGGQKGGS